MTLFFLLLQLFYVFYFMYSSVSCSVSIHIVTDLLKVMCVCCLIDHAWTTKRYPHGICYTPMMHADTCTEYNRYVKFTNKAVVL